MRHAVIALILLGSLTRSVFAEEVARVQDASVDTWVVIVAAVVSVLIIGVASFFSPKRAHEN